MPLTLRQRTLGLVGLVLVLSIVVLGITFRAIVALEKERETQQVRSLFLSADRSRQEFLRNHDLLHSARADEALVRADSVFQASLTSPGDVASGGGLRDSIEAYRALLFDLTRTLQTRGLGSGDGLVGRFRITAQSAADVLKRSGRADLVNRLLEVRQAEQTFLHADLWQANHAALRDAVPEGVRALKESIRQTLPPAARQRLYPLLDRYLAQFLQVADLTARLRQLDARTSALYARQSKTLAQAAQAESALASRYEWAAGLTILATCLLGLWAAGWTTRTLVRPILALQRAAERIASGEKDVRVPASDAMDWEIRNLAQALSKVRVHVAERREAEEQLRAARQFSETILDSVGEGIVAVDDDLRYVTWNPYAEQFTGHREADVLGKKVTTVFPEAARDGIVACYRRALGGARAQSDDVQLVHAETGEPRWYAASYAPLHGPGDTVSGVVGTFHDVTARRRAEDHLRRAKEKAEETARLKSSFVASMSHELRTPLASVLGFAEAIADEPAGPHIEEFAGHIRSSGERLQRTMNAVLELSRLESGSIETDLEPVSLTAEAHDTADLLRPLAKDRPVALSVQNDDERVPVQADRAKLGQVLNNLVSNALKFTEEGTVTIEVARTDDDGLIRVRDPGVGIDAAFLPHLFEAFRQESTGLTRDFAGSGLGLAITDRLVDLMGGSIDVESEKGVGTCFTVTLPLAPGAPPLVDEPEPVPTAAPLPLQSNAPVLVVEDNENTRRLVAHCLETVCDVHCVADAASALALAEQTPFRALLLDIDLGDDVGGEALLRQLRTLPAYADVPAVAFTAYALPEDADRFRAAGFDGYLAKPFTRHELTAALDDALRVTQA